jgi:hypothetical protein
MTDSIEVEGLEPLIRDLSADLSPALTAVTKAIAAEAQDRIAPYPPATEAKSPSNPAGRWYERGFGPKWRRKDGSVGGRKTSETLGRRWSIKSAPQQATLTNLASYSNVVHGAEEQASFHATRGWRADEGVADEIVDDGTVARMVEAAIAKKLGKLLG